MGYLLFAGPPRNGRRCRRSTANGASCDGDDGQQRSGLGGTSATLHLTALDVGDAPPAGGLCAAGPQNVRQQQEPQRRPRRAEHDSAQRIHVSVYPDGFRYKGSAQLHSVTGVQVVIDML